MPVHRYISGLLWDDGNEEHIERRLSPTDVEDFIERGDFVMFRNTRDHPPGRFKLIGPMRSDTLWTVILEEPADGNSDHWRPITAFRSGAFDCHLYDQEQARLRKKGGGRHD